MFGQPSMVQGRDAPPNIADFLGLDAGTLLLATASLLVLVAALGCYTRLHLSHLLWRLFSLSLFQEGSWTGMKPRSLLGAFALLCCALTFAYRAVFTHLLVHRARMRPPFESLEELGAFVASKRISLIAYSSVFPQSFHSSALVRATTGRVEIEGNSSRLHRRLCVESGLVGIGDISITASVHSERQAGCHIFTQPIPYASRKFTG